MRTYPLLHARHAPLERGDIAVQCLRVVTVILAVPAKPLLFAQLQNRDLIGELRQVAGQPRHGTTVFLDVRIDRRQAFMQCAHFLTEFLHDRTVLFHFLAERRHFLADRHGFLPGNDHFFQQCRIVNDKAVRAIAHPQVITVDLRTQFARGLKLACIRRHHHLLLIADEQRIVPVGGCIAVEPAIRMAVHIRDGGGQGNSRHRSTAVAAADQDEAGSKCRPECQHQRGRKQLARRAGGRGKRRKDQA